VEDIVAERTTGLPPVLKRFCIWVAAMTLLSEAYSWAMSFFFHLRPPYGGTFTWQDAGWDLMIYQPRFLFFRTPHFWDPMVYPYTYPAPLAPVYWLFYHVPHPLRVYLVLSSAALALWAWYFAGKIAAHRASRLWTFVLLVLFLVAAWPVRFLLQTGNLETLVAFILGVGILAAMRGRWTVAAVLIGIAGSMKIYPLMLLGLVLSQRRYQEFAWGVIAAALTTTAALALLGPSIFAAQRHIDEGLAFLTPRYILAPLPDGLRFNHSLFSLVKAGVAAVDHVRHPIGGAAPADALRATRTVREFTQMHRALQVYVPIVAALALALYWLRIKHLPMLNQIVILSVGTVLLPPFSFDYSLVQLLVPLGLLCVYTMDKWRHSEQPHGLALAFTCFALIFTTGAYFQIHYQIAAQVRTLALIVLVFAALNYPFAAAGEPA